MTFFDTLAIFQKGYVMKRICGGWKDVTERAQKVDLHEEIYGNFEWTNKKSDNHPE